MWKSFVKNFNKHVCTVAVNKLIIALQLSFPQISKEFVNSIKLQLAFKFTDNCIDELLIVFISCIFNYWWFVSVLKIFKSNEKSYCWNMWNLSNKMQFGAFCYIVLSNSQNSSLLNSLTRASYLKEYKLMAESLNETTPASLITKSNHINDYFHILALIQSRERMEAASLRLLRG